MFSRPAWLVLPPLAAIVVVLATVATPAQAATYWVTNASDVNAGSRGCRLTSGS